MTGMKVPQGEGGQDQGCPVFCKPYSLWPPPEGAPLRAGPSSPPNSSRAPLQPPRPAGTLSVPHRGGCQVLSAHLTQSGAPAGTSKAVTCA